MDAASDDRGNERQWRHNVPATVEMFLARFLKGFTSGAALYGGVMGVSALMRNPFRERLPDILKQIFSKDCLRFAGFLGLYPSTYELAREILQERRNSKDGWNNCIAGGLAGLTIGIEDPSRRLIYTLFAVSRAFGALVSTLVTREKIPEIPYSETLLFSVCCGFLVHCVALRPDLLHKGYYYSVLKWSRDYKDKTLQILFRDSGDRFLTCQEVGLHSDSCTKHAFKDMIFSIPAFAKLYLPIHLAPVIIFRRKLVIEKPKRVLKSLVRNMLFSTSFLASMVMLAKYTICLLRNLNNKPPPLPSYIPVVGGLVCGLSVLFERANRRKELSLFLIPHTLYALYTWIKGHRLASHIDVPYGSVLLYAVSMISIMHAYEREPESLSLLLNGVLRFFVGDIKNPVVRPRKRIRQLSDIFV
ncbi:uncharacterized protein LOC110465398 [Mizuhopecten yessoensis]|uniref:uncharacterized protein LOC110465398 n=1 Tax=Mizuhopecten yessoensis TaxID=6573 RepID=UPI000B457623|nr:uncharacterized protein LOC110465398 [Mizuhopecten yessoensis]